MVSNKPPKFRADRKLRTKEVKQLPQGNSVKQSHCWAYDMGLLVPITAFSYSTFDINS